MTSGSLCVMHPLQTDLFHVKSEASMPFIHSLHAFKSVDQVRCSRHFKIYGSPPACPVLGSSPPCVRKPCSLQVFPDIIHLARASLARAIHMSKQHTLW